MPNKALLSLKFATGSRRNITGVLLVGGLLYCAPSAMAAAFSQNFEADQTSNYSELKGKNAEGSKLEISAEKAHEGKQSLKLTYKSTGGWIEFTPNQVQKLNFVGDKLQLSMWVHGSGRRDFIAGAVRFLDNNNESFQFDIPGFAEALAGEGWRELRAEIDLTKTGAHWGDNSDGKLDRPFGYLGLAATRNAQTEATGTAYIDDLRITDGIDTPPIALPVATLKAAATITPATTAATGAGASFLKWVLAPGAPAVFQANIQSQAGPLAGIARWKVRDAFGKAIAEGEEKLDGAGPGKNFTFHIENPPRGVLYATITVLNDREEVVTEASGRLAVFTPHQKPVPIDNFVWGVAAHVGRENGKNASEEIALMRLLGFAASRSDMTWSSVQPTANVWNWESTDQIYKTFEREGIMPMPLLAYGTRWATTGDATSTDWHQWFNAPPKTEPFTNFVREAVKRYKHQTRYWEIWNEPDIDFWLGTAPQYAALVDATIPVIKAEQPEALVMNGGFSETKRRPDFIPTYLKTVKTQPDIYAIHTHGAFENFLRAQTTINADLASAGLTGAKRPQVWLNEAGYSHARGGAESEQAIQLVKKMAYAPAIGLGAYVWYDLRDDGTDPNENEHNFGLVKNDFRPKASAVAVSTLLDTIGTKRFSQRLPLDSTGYALTYQGGNQTALAAWRQSQSKGDAVLPLVIRATAPGNAPFKLERRDIFGNSTPVPIQDGLFLLSLGNVPQYIVASSGAVKFELAGQNGLLLDYSPSIVVAPGETLNWPVKVTNPFSVPLKGRLIVDGSAPIAVEVAAKTTRPYTIALKRGGASGAREMLGLRLETAQLPAPLTGSAEVQTAYVIPSAPENLSVEMPRRGIVSLFEATPMQHLHFKDGADLSATIQFQKTAQGTQARVVATDQTHFPFAEPNQWWQGDSIQWAIGLPDGQMWEWMGALLPDGPHMVLGLAPDGKTGSASPISIRREGNQTIYEWTLPRVLPNGQPLPERFNFDFIVNDNDGQGRKGWIEWTPGIGMEKNPAGFVPLAVGK